MLNVALTRLAADLERVGIDYAVIEPIALNRHRYRRFTEDIDLPEEFADQLDESVREKYRQLWQAVEQGKAERS